MTTRQTIVALSVAAGAALVAAPTLAWADAADTPDDDVTAWEEAGDGVPNRMGGAWRDDAGHGARGDRGADDDAYGSGGRRGGCMGDGTGAAGLVEDGAEATAADAESLALMAEEERMARDLYVELADAWDLRVLDAISRAEQRHMDALDSLLDAYGLDSPNDDAVAGVYEDADLQAMYDELLAQGSESETAALGVGALVEETDIADLREQDVDADAIAQVYDRLEHASEHHLRAFVRTLDRLDAPYEASVLDPGEVEDITGVTAP